MSAFVSKADREIEQLSRTAAVFNVVNRYVGNLAPMPGVFPDG